MTASHHPRAPQLVLELAAMVQKDQKVRQGTQYDPTIDAANTERLKQIIAEFGWPGRTLVGEQGACDAWLLAQHADHDLDFQIRVLGLMRAAAPGEVQPSHIAYLEDRICVAQQRPQVYGTQGYSENGQWKPRPIAEHETVDERRKQVGLEPLADYIAQCARFYHRS